MTRMENLYKSCVGQKYRDRISIEYFKSIFFKSKQDLLSNIKCHVKEDDRYTVLYFAIVGFCFIIRKSDKVVAFCNIGSIGTDISYVEPRLHEHFVKWTDLSNLACARNVTNDKCFPSFNSNCSSSNQYRNFYYDHSYRFYYTANGLYDDKKPPKNKKHGKLAHVNLLQSVSQHIRTIVSSNLSQLGILNNPNSSFTILIARKIRKYLNIRKYIFYVNKTLKSYLDEEALSMNFKICQLLNANTFGYNYIAKYKDQILDVYNNNRAILSYILPNFGMRNYKQDFKEIANSPNICNIVRGEIQDRQLYNILMKSKSSDITYFTNMLSMETGYVGVSNVVAEKVLLIHKFFKDINILRKHKKALYFACLKLDTYGDGRSVYVLKAFANHVKSMYKNINFNDIYTLKRDLDLVRDWMSHNRSFVFDNNQRNARWSWFMRQQENWHDQIREEARQQQLELIEARKTPYAYEIEGNILYDINGTTFIAEPILLYKDLYKEGEEMHHCVSSYHESCYKLESRIYKIYSTDNNPDNRATCEIRNGIRKFHVSDKLDTYTVGQCYGKYNSIVNDSVSTMAKHVCQMYNTHKSDKLSVAV